MTDFGEMILSANMADFYQSSVVSLSFQQMIGCFTLVSNFPFIETAIHFVSRNSVMT